MNVPVISKRDMLDLAGVDPVLDPVFVAAKILAQRPEVIPTLPHFDMPDFASFDPLARIVGASGDSRLQAVASLATHRAAINDAVIGGATLAGIAAAELGSTAAWLMKTAGLLPAIAASPAGPVGAALFAATAASKALAEAKMTIDSLERDLSKLASELEQATATATAKDTPGPGAAGGAAEQKLAQLASTPAAAAPTGTTPAPPEVKPAAAPVAEPTPAPAQGSSVGAAAVAAAKSQLGTPYVWGGSQPGGFDCSGLTSWAYRQAGMDIPRIAADQAIGRQVSYQELQPGDLAVWDGHVAMYAGDGMYIEAGDPVALNPVRTDNIGMTFRGFWRPTG